MIKKKLVSLVSIAAISLTTLCVYSTSSVAADNPPPPDNSSQPVNPPPPPGWHPHDHMPWFQEMMGKMHKHHELRSPYWDLGLSQHKNLTADEAKIIAQAALLMNNRRDLKVGNISPKSIHNRSYYIIQIVDAQGNIVSTVLLDKDTGVIRPAHKHQQEGSNNKENPAEQQ